MSLFIILTLGNVVHFVLSRLPGLKLFLKFAGLLLKPRQRAKYLIRWTPPKLKRGKKGMKNS